MVTGPTAPVTRRELVDRLRRRLCLSAREANELLDGFLETLTDQLAEDGIVSLSGLGRLETRLTPARPGRNPKTGREVVIPARRRPVFTLSRTLRTRLKETAEKDQPE
jgi:nucleoid DNA-binding protein